jgi:hypothetical protein
LASKEQRLTRGAVALLDRDLEVVAQDTEWADGDPESSDDEDDDRLRRRIATLSSDRETRLSTWGELLQQDVLLGYSDLEVVAQNTEWDAGVLSSDDDDNKRNLQRHLTDNYRSRERRLTVSTDLLEKGVQLGDTDLEVVAQTTEWAAGLDSSDEEDTEKPLERHSSDRFRARERRISVSQQALDEEKTLGDQDVEILAQNAEWAGDSDGDSDEEDEDGQVDIFKARERRLTLSFEMLKEEKSLGDQDVEVITQDTEWLACGDSDEEDDGQILKCQQALYEAREVRRKLTAEILESAVPIGDLEVEIVQQEMGALKHSEWASMESDEEDEDVKRHATDSFERREKRLTMSTQGSRTSTVNLNSVNEEEGES